jgi:N-acetyl sugar amidotransferase
MDIKPDMTLISYPANVDKASFQTDAEVSKTRFGLPQDVKFCKRCVISNQRPSSSIEFKTRAGEKKATINLDEDGICDACRVAEQKKDVDWNAREAELRELCDRHRRNDGRYDCVVPGSGGKDSFYASHILKYQYNMHPLTVTWAPHIYTDWGWRNFQRWIGAGFDNQLHTPNPRVHRLLTRLAMDVLLHPFQAFILGQKNLAPKISALLDIPLVFFGENEAEYGNARADAAKPMRDATYFAASDFSEFRLGGVPIAELEENFGIDRSEMMAYLPADPVAIAEAGTEVQYLGYYLKWHPQSCYYYSQKHGGFEPSPERTTGTYSKYNSIDDRIDDFHYYTTFIKFGIGRATYDAAQEIRSDDIDREEGVALVRRYDGEYPERFMDEVLRYLSISETEFPVASKLFEQPIMDREYLERLCDTFRSPHIWKHENGSWALRHTVWQNG